MRAYATLPLLLILLVTLLAGCRGRGSTQTNPKVRTAVPLVDAFEGIATPIGSPLPSIPLRLTLREEGDSAVAEIFRLAQTWYRFGAAEGKNEDGVLTLTAVDPAGNAIELVLTRRKERLTGFALIFDRQVGHTVRYGVELEKL